jgi:protein gp37
MSAKSKIEWTDATWNPVRGCTKVSPGCQNCYAEKFAERFRGVPGHPFEQGFDLKIIPEKLHEPLRWKTPRMIFVNSMSDLFHDFIPDEYIEHCFDVMASAKWHTYQVLTKRPERMRSLFSNKLKKYSHLMHIWCGVSVENKKHGIPRIEILRKTKCSVKFLSMEPLLENLGEINLKSIDWLIVGGESGNRSRPLKREWVKDIQIQCESQQVPFFFKQWGGYNKKANGRELDGQTFTAMPNLFEPILIPQTTYG